MTLLAALIGAAAVAFGLAKATRLPSIPFLVAAGLALQATPITRDHTLLGDVLMLGLTMLLFGAGAELDERRTREPGRAAVVVGLSQLGALGGAAWLGAWAFGYPPLTSAFIALSIGASSSLVAVRLLRRRQQFFEPFGRLTVGVLLLQTILTLVGMAALSKVEGGLPAAESAMFRTVLLGGVALLASRTVTPWLLLRNKLDEEAVLMAMLSLLFGFLGLAWWLDLPMAIGAFCAGYAVSPFPVNGLLRSQIASLNDFFLAIFFVALGADLTMPGLSEVAVGFALAAFVLVATPLIVTLIGRRAGVTTTTSLEAGLLLAQTSEISVVIGLFGKASGHVSDALFAALTVCAIVTMSVTPLIANERVAYALLRLHPFASRQHHPLDVRDHLVVLGCGPNTLPLVSELVAGGWAVVVVDDDDGVVAQARAVGATAVRGDASTPPVLAQVRIAEARAVLSTLRRPAQHARVVAAAGAVPVLVRAFDGAEAAVLRALGGEVVITAEVSARAFLAWFDERFSATPIAQAEAGA